MAPPCSSPALAGLARDYVLGRLERACQRAFEDHLAGCAPCAERVGRLHDAVGALAHAMSDRATGTTLPRLLRLPAGVAAAASLAVALAMLVDFGSRVPPRDPGSADSPAPEAIGGLVPAGTIPAAPRLLRWSAPAGSEPCRASIARPDLSLMWESPTTRENEVALPDDHARALRPGERYVWRVGCGEGARAITSRDAEFRIVAPR